MSVKIDTSAQAQMKTALEAYKKDKNSVKEFYPCTQNITAWLKEKEK